MAIEKFLSNIVVDGTISKVGGTSSQFLKANGSIDSSSYQTIGATHYIGTTSIANNRASLAQTLTGVSIDGTSKGLLGTGGFLTHPGQNELEFAGQISAGTAGLFPTVDNSNTVINLNRHDGEYNSQLGFSSNGNMYYRAFSNTVMNTTQPWRTVWDSNSLTNNNQLSNGAGYLTSETDTLQSVMNRGNNTTSTIHSTLASPFINYLSGYKSWQFHHPSNNTFMLVPSTAIDGTTWDWSNGVSFNDNGSITANIFNGALNGTANNANTLGTVNADRFLYGDGPRGRSKNRTNLNANTSSELNSSGFYYGSTTTGMPDTGWYNWITCAGNEWEGTDGYAFQFGNSFWSDSPMFRRMTSGTWNNWHYMLHDANFNSYAPTLGGAGATGTWGISITGNANSSTTSVSSTVSGHLSTAYASGVQTNPQVYFNQNIGLKVAMTGVPSAWADTLWINGYYGNDVLDMCALHTLRNGQPRMYISSQQSTATAYGTTYEFLTDYNYSSRQIFSSGLSVGTAGTRAGALVGVNAIAIGDGDTGFRQNGDGVLETYANNTLVKQETSSHTTLGNNNIFGVVADGVTNDPYGRISVTRGTASNFSYYGLTRAGQIGWSLGINTSNEFIIGTGASGGGVISGVQMTINSSGVLTSPSHIISTSGYIIAQGGGYNGVYMGSPSIVGDDVGVFGGYGDEVIAALDNSDGTYYYGGTWISCVPGEGTTIIGRVYNQKPASLGITTTGEIVKYGTGTTVAGRLYYLNSSAVWTEADADAVSSSSGMLAIAVGTNPTGEGMLVRGSARFTGLSSYTAATNGQILYVSGTAGEFTATAPTGTGKVVRVIGYCVDATNDTIYFCPDNTWVELV